MKKFLVLAIATLGLVHGSCNAAKTKKIKMNKTYKIPYNTQDEVAFLRNMSLPEGQQWKDVCVVLNYTKDSFNLNKYIELESHEYIILPFKNVTCPYQLHLSKYAREVCGLEDGRTLCNNSFQRIKVIRRTYNGNCPSRTWIDGYSE